MAGARKKRSTLAQLVRRSLPKYKKRKARKYSILKRVGNPNLTYAFARTVNITSETAVVNNWLELASAGAGFNNTGGAKWLIDNGVQGTMNYWAFSYKFSLANIPNLTEFTNLFDEYRISKIKVRFTPYSTQVESVTQDSTATQAVGGLSPIMHYVIDHDDDNTPTANEAGIQTLQEYNTYRKVRMIGDNQKDIVLMINPKSPGAVETIAGLTIAGTTRYNAWLDLAQTSIPHYGLKGVFECLSPRDDQSSFVCRIETTYYMEFRGAR